MTAITTPRFKESTDSLLRFAMRADAILSGITGIASIPLAGWLAEISGTTKAFAAKPSVRRAGLMVAIGNVLFTVACVVFVLADVFPLTTTGVALILGTGVYTAAIGELQYQGWRRAKA
jgi:CHASE2 domain-containing sensor protein